MKIVIDLENFYLDEESDLEPALKKHIISEAVRQINNSIEDKIKGQVHEEIKCLVNRILTKETTNKVKNFIAEGKVKSRRNSSELVTIEERIKEDYEYDVGYNTLRDVVKGYADRSSKEIKQRYDLLFASQLVAKLNEAGMLKEDVAKMLLS